MFRSMVPELREQYLRVRNQELAATLSDVELSQTDRFWITEEQVGKVAKVLRACLDGHSRSKMEFYMMVMLTHGMMTTDDLANFSDEVRERFSMRMQ